MLFIRMYEPKDYPTVCEWWKRHKWPALTEEMLSDFGAVVFNDTELVCAGWLYLMTRYWALIEWIVTNPDVPRVERHAGIELLLDALIHEARGFNARAIFSSLHSRGLMKLFEKKGFQKTDTNMTNFVMNIQPLGE